MITLNEKLVTFKIETEEDPSSIDDAFADAEVRAGVHEEVNKGNEFAWFCASVTASIKLGDTVLTADDHMGACSYESEKDWLESDELSDLKNNALIYLQDKVNNLLDGLKDMERDQDMDDYLESNSL